MHSATPALLLLADGTEFHGQSFGATGTTTGEMCFNTGMTGYQEVFTDPSYTGQILVMNNVHIGNYGTKPADVESSRVRINGLVARNLEERFSRLQATDSLHNYLLQHNVVAIEGIDTRALVTHIRTKGAMNGLISSEGKAVEELKEMLAQCPDMQGLDLASHAGTKEAYELPVANAQKQVAVIDFGIKRNMLHCFAERNIGVKVFPASTPAADILASNPDGIFISNGPGDPAAMPQAHELVRQVVDSGKPVFGICLGHQLLALSNGVSTYKMHHGHRGINHPVMNLRTGRSEITTQNHGFGVNPEEVKSHPDLEVTHVNLNDGSVEGIRMKSKPAFSVQYHPESTPGPHDSRYLFDDFLALMNGN